MMKNKIKNLFGKAEQGQEDPATTATVITIETKTKPPQRVLDITEVVDDGAIKALIDQFKKAGEIIVGAVSKNGEYEFDMDGAPPALKELLMLRNKTIDLSRSMVNFVKNRYTAYRNELEALLDIATEQMRKDAFLKQNAAAITRAVSEAEKPLAEVEAKEAQMRDARGKKEEAEDKRSKIANEQYGGHPPEKRAIPLWLYALIFAAIFPVETMLNIGALDSIESSLQARFVLPTALTITGMIALLAHFLGGFIGNKSHKGLIAVAVGAAVMMLGIVFFLRANAVQSELVLTVINLAAFLLMSGLSYIYHKDDPYFKADEAYEKWRDIEHELQKDIEAIRKTVKDEVTAIHDEWNAKMEKAIEGEVKPLKLEILHLEREENAFDNYFKTRVFNPVQTMYAEFSAQAEINFYKARKKNGLPVTMPEPKAELQGEDVEISEAEDNPDPKMNGRHNGNGLGRLSDLKNGLYVLLMGLSLFGFTACEIEDVPPQHKEVIIVGDASIAEKDSASLPTPEQQLSFILDRIDFTPYEDRLSVTRDHIRIQATHIGETSFPPVQMIELAEGESIGSMVKTKRRAAQKAFIEDIRAAIEIHTKAKSLPSSRVFDCLCRILPPLATSQADHKEVLIVSDMLEHSDIDDFYTLHARMPGQFQTIKDRFETHCPALKDVSFSDVHFTAVYLPDKARDKSARFARMFWEKYIESKGGKIAFMPNLPDVKSMQIAHH